MSTDAAGPPVFTLHHGRLPLLVSVPHAGQAIPSDQRHRYVERALAVEDTDWHLERLWAFVVDAGASLLVPHHSRYLIDLNRPVEDTPMYPGRNNTGLLPACFFTGEPLYRPGLEPDADERQRRIDRYWQPYHDALRDELERLRTVHGHAVLFDAHSIRSELPWLFEGRLPTFNLGTVDGTSCASTLRADLVAVLDRHVSAGDCVVDARFKGGHITRHYGRPDLGIHAVQLEMCWRAYMDEDAMAWDDRQVLAVRPLLADLVSAMTVWRPR
jgi:N-formylglutamate deformylase